MRNREDSAQSKSEALSARSPVGANVTHWRGSRRELIRRGAAAGVLVALPGGVLAAYGATAPSILEPLIFFTPDQARTVEAVVERLVPSDDNGPGAKDALVWRYIDRLLTTPANTYRGVNNPGSDLTDAYRAGLQALDAYAETAHGGAFASLSSAAQDAVLTAMQANSATGFTPDSKTFFNLIRQHTLEGMFSDPYYGGNANFVGWNMLGFPGIKLLFTADEQKLDVTITSAHKSVTQVGFFGNDRKGM